MKRTFQEAGWEIAVDKVQLGLRIDLFGLGITMHGDGSLFVQEAKRQGLILDIESQLQAAASGEEVARAQVEQLVGRL